MNNFQYFLKKMTLLASLLICSGVVTSIEALSPDTGIPRLSDVVFSTRWYHPAEGGVDPNNSLNSFHSFHGSRIVWDYLDTSTRNINFVHTLQAAGIPVGGAVNPTYILPVPFPADPNTSGAKLDVNLKPVLAAGRPYYGCPVSPYFVPYFTNEQNLQLSFNVDTMQVDDGDFWRYFVIPGSTASNTNKCYCDFCNASFVNYLKSTKSTSQLASVGITDLSTFNYRKFVLANGWDPASMSRTIEQWYNLSAINNVIAFWKANYTAAQNHAGKKITFSANGFQQAPGFPFDYAMSEFSPSNANPQFVYNDIQTSLNTYKHRLVYSLIGTDLLTNRLMIGWTTGSGGNMIVPWDVYQTGGAPRYYGLPENYADLYGMIRAVPQYLDGYAAFQVAGYGFSASSFLTVGNATTGATNTVSAFVRSNTVSPSQQPWVIHLVDSAKTPQSTVLKLAKGQLTSDSNTSFTLTIPLPYCKDIHDLAESIGDYSILVETIQLPFVKNSDGSYTIHVPPVSPWGIIVVNGTKSS